MAKKRADGGSENPGGGDGNQGDQGDEPVLTVLQTFKWAHDGIRIVEYKEGEVLDTEDEDLIRVATAEGWIG